MNIQTLIAALYLELHTGKSEWTSTELLERIVFLESLP